jgi:hypothetical protein
MSDLGATALATTWGELSISKLGCGLWSEQLPTPVALAVGATLVLLLTQHRMRHAVADVAETAVASVLLVVLVATVVGLPFGECC